MASRKRRTQQEIFLDGLLELAGAEDVGVSNTAFRNHLGWDQEKYNCIAPGSLDTSLSHAAGLSDIAVCHA